jgi:hypothetical protein
MPNEKEPTRESLFERFLGGSQRAWREEKVLQYIVHRIDEGIDLREVLQEPYLRRICSQGEIDRIIRDPELLQACRERLERAFGSGELDPTRVRRKPSPTSINGSPTTYSAASDPISPGDEQILRGKRWTPPHRCDHSGPTMVERTEGGYTMVCIVCRKVGPVRRTPEAARKALLVLGARDGWR